MDGLATALRFLTVLPWPGGAEEGRGSEGLGRSTAWFPVVGLLLGGMVACLDALVRLVWPVSVASAAVIVALILLTGALHLDGLIDTCDGLFGARDPARRLEIMRDSRVGSFGVLGAFCILLAKYASLDALAGPSRAGALVLAPTLGRFAMTLAVRGFPYARAEGLGLAFKDGCGGREAIFATLVALAVSLATLRAAGGAAMLASAAAAFLLAGIARRRIGGLTGDTYGAVCEVAETVTLLVAAAAAASGTGGSA